MNTRNILLFFLCARVRSSECAYAYTNVNLNATEPNKINVIFAFTARKKYAQRYTELKKQQQLGERKTASPFV